MLSLHRLFGLLVFLPLGLVLPAFAQPRPLVVVPDYSSSSVDGFFHLELDTGQTFSNDQLFRSEIRVRRLGQNLFTEIGRPSEPPAREGEVLLGPIRDGDGALRSVLLVESSTGYLAYFEDLGRGSSFGEISVVIGRPFGPMAATDGNFLLLMRRDRSGRTEGAYLYHGTTGRGMYVGGLRKLEAEPPTASTSGLPQLEGPVAGVDLQTTREATTGYLLADSATGDLYVVDLTTESTSQLAHRKSTLNLTAALALETAAPEGEGEAAPPSYRLVGLPILEDDATRHALFVDVLSGQILVVQDLDSRPTLRKLRARLYDVIDAQDPESRHLSLVPAIRDGDTTGVWVVDGPTRAIVYIENPATPGATVLRRIGYAGR